MLLSKKVFILLVFITALFSQSSRADEMACANLNVGWYSTTLCFKKIVKPKDLDQLTAMVVEEVTWEVDKVTNAGTYWWKIITQYLNKKFIKMFVKKVVVIFSETNKHYKRALEEKIGKKIEALYLEQALNEVSKQNPGIKINVKEVGGEISADLKKSLKLFVSEQSKEIVAKTIKAMKENEE